MTTLEEMRAQSEDPESADASLDALRQQSDSPAKVQRSTLERLDRLLGQVSSPFWESTIGGLEQLSEWIELSEAEMVGRSAKVRAPGEHSAPFEALTAPPPENAAERVGRDVGTGLNTYLSYFVPAARAVRTKPTLGTPSTIPAKERVTRSVIEPLATRPGPAVAAETAASAGAGLGMGVAQEAVPGSPVAELAGGVVGGMVPGSAQALGRLTRFAPSRMAFNAVRELVDPRAATRADTSAAAGTVREAMTPEAQANLLRTRDLERSINTRAPFSLAERTESPQLMAVQRDIEDEATGSTLDALVRRRRTIEEDIRRFGQTAGPPRVDNDGVVIDVAKQRVEAARNTGQQLEVQLAGRKATTAATLPTSDKFAQGGAMRQKIAEARKAKSAEMSSLANRLGLNEDTTTFDLRPLQQSISDRFKRKSDFDVPPPAITKRIRDYGREDVDDAALSPLEREMRAGMAADQPVEINFQGLKDMRERVSDELIDSMAAANPDTRKVRDLVRTKQLIDEFVNSAEPTGGGDLAQNWRQFRSQYYDEFVRRFEEGAAFKVRAHGAREEYRVVNERVADTFLKGPTQVKQYKEIFGEEGELTTALLDRARATVLKDGVIDPIKLKSFVAQQTNNGVLAEMPEAQAILSNLRETTQALSAREVQLAKRQALIERSELAAIVGEPNVTPIVKTALNDPNYMRQIFSELPQSAHAGMRRAIWEEAVGQLGPLEIKNAVPFANFLKSRRPALEVAFSKQHLDDLDKILEATRKLTLLDVPEGTVSYGSLPEKIERATGTGVSQASSRIFAVSSGRTSARYTAIDWFARLFNLQSKNRTRALMSGAIYDPEVARVLAGTVDRPQLSTPQMGKVRSWLFTMGYPLLDQEKDAN